MTNRLSAVLKPTLTAALFCLAALPALAQNAPADMPTSTITVRSSLVVVPALVRTKSGELVFTLTADDFTLTDDGIPQKLRLEDDTGAQPLALVIVVQTGGSAAGHLAQYRDLSTLLDNLVGAVDHKIAVVGYDSTPTLLHGFTPNTAFIEKSLNQLDPGDDHAATLDALSFSVNLLRQQPTTYRRAVLLLSETLDQGSHTSLDQALHDISDTNTAIYSIGFNSTKAQLSHEAAKLSDNTPGPAHGCFSRDFGTDENGDPIPPPTSAGTQTFDCFAELAPPLRLARMAAILARNNLRRNVSESVAKLTGGEHFKFSDAKSLDRALFTLSNHLPNRYTLSFHPQNPHSGFHLIDLKLVDRPQLRVDARNGYWVNAESK